MLNPRLANSCSTKLFNSLIASSLNRLRNLENVEWSGDGPPQATRPRPVQR